MKVPAPVAGSMRIRSPRKSSNPSAKHTLQANSHPCVQVGMLPRLLVCPVVYPRPLRRREWIVPIWRGLFGKERWDLPWLTDRPCLS